MTRTSALSLIALAMAGATAAVTLTLPASASIANHLKRCNGLAYSEALGCCEAAVERQRPLWMMDSNHCRSPGVIVCKGGGSTQQSFTHVAAAPKRVCMIVPRSDAITGGKNDSKTNDQPSDKRQGGGKQF